MGSHYVPQKYLAGFVSSSRPAQVWMYDKKTGKSCYAAIRNVAQETGYYPPETERQLADLEGSANRALDSLRVGAAITAQEREYLAFYMATMMSRVPRRRRVAQDLYPAALEETFREQHPVLEAWARSAADSQQVQFRLAEIDGIRTKFRKAPPKEVVKQVRSPWPSRGMVTRVEAMTWRILPAGQDQFYITSDNPAYFFEDCGIGNPRSELVFPISTQLALVANWQGARAATLYMSARASFTKEINRRIASGAERFVFSHRQASWIRTLATRRDPFLSWLVWLPTV